MTVDFDPKLRPNDFFRNRFVFILLCFTVQFFYLGFLNKGNAYNTLNISIVEANNAIFSTAYGKTKV